MVVYGGLFVGSIGCGDISEEAPPYLLLIGIHPHVLASPGLFHALEVILGNAFLFSGGYLIEGGLQGKGGGLFTLYLSAGFLGFLVLCFVFFLF